MEAKKQIIVMPSDHSYLVKAFGKDVGRFRNCMILYQAALKTVCTKLDILNDEFMLIHKRNPIAHITSRIKTPGKIVDKLQRKGFEVSIDSMWENLFDIAGIRIVCAFLEDIYLIADLLKAQGDVELIKELDYIKDPKPNGYRSYHLIMAVPVFLSDRMEMVNVEVQIRTIAMDFWATLEHDLYYKKGRKAPADIVADLTECAQSIAEIDHRMQQIKKQVDALGDE